jgi:hypothetical protein
MDNAFFAVAFGFFLFLLLFGCFFILAHIATPCFRSMVINAV